MVSASAPSPPNNSPAAPRGNAASAASESGSTAPLASKALSSGRAGGLALPTVSRTGSVRRGRGGAMASPVRQVARGIDGLALTADLEMQLDAVGVAVAHFGDLLALLNRL